MGDIDVRVKRSQKFKDGWKKTRHDQGDLRGAFATKAIDPRKGTYKRTKMRVEDIDIESFDDE